MSQGSATNSRANNTASWRESSLSRVIDKEPEVGYSNSNTSSLFKLQSSHRITCIHPSPWGGFTKSQALCQAMEEGRWNGEKGRGLLSWGLVSDKWPQHKLVWDTRGLKKDSSNGEVMRGDGRNPSSKWRETGPVTTGSTTVTEISRAGRTHGVWKQGKDREAKRGGLCISRNKYVQY